jgi:hypothetical protein
MNIKRLSTTCFFILISIAIQFLQSNAQAAEIYFSQNHKDAGVEFTLKVNEVQKLAGLKISITYPDQLITYIDSTRSAETSSFMHVINDKNPGKLIIVMASGRGISGENVPLLNLRFTLSNTNKTLPLILSATECQLMAENLNEIDCSIK